MGLLAALLLAGCSPSANDEVPARPSPLSVDRSAGAFAQTDPWLLTTTDPNAARGNRGIFLGNGYLGATFGADGGAGPDSACYVAGVYDNRENLAPIPSWNKLDLPPSSENKPYSQTLDMKRGVLVTRRGGVTVTSFVSRADPNLAVLHVDGAPAPQRPPNLPPPPRGTVTRMSNTHTVYQIARTTLSLHVTQTPDPSGAGWTRFVTVLPDPTFAAFQAQVEQDAKDPYTHSAHGYEARVTTPSYAQALARHTAAWAKLWEKDIVIQGDAEAQQLVHSLMFNLLQSIRPGGGDSVAPEALAGDFYKGHIFWDADVWMFPALLAQHPDLARGILEYRYQRLSQARRRAQASGYRGADFPWESANTGREVAPGGFREGRHVTAGVGWAHWQYWLATRDTRWLRARGWPVLRGVADHFTSRAERNPATGKYVLQSVMGPDENKGLVNNNTYTNALAAYCLRAAGQAARILKQPADPRWADVARNLTLPFDKQNARYRARDDDDGGKTKQADGELILYPAQLPMPNQTALNTFRFHAARPIASGPAMTASIHALLAARLGQSADAENYFRNAYRPFVRGPFLQFSEKRSLDRCYFATGAGGILQSVLYGFGGLRWEDFDRPVPVERVSALPPSWKRLTITGIAQNANRYTLEVTQQTRTLTRQNKKN